MRNEEVSRLTVRRVISTDPETIWKRVAGGSFTGCWIAPAGGDEGAGSGLGAEEAAWRESLRLGPFSFKVAGTWAERVPWERSFCLLDGPLGVRIAEEMRLERLAAGTALSLTVDFALGGGGIGEWLDRVWLSGWVSRRLERGISKLEEEYGRPEDEKDQDLGVHLERPEDRPWGLDRTGPERPKPPRPE
jgi:hypothetical protein